ncbi:uncharacterized protein [Drosophila pseudoobscura]|uniref:Uncharacterized protein isoform X1 n=1 Tax=Drosophila pseudoobscura pseudoobscura TaxID=46245 RepID=A0A6I8W823_DROPS|nr:uncharacterized protein LOC6900009 isoform X1 [Drosophila pseudoobscura]
MDSIGDDSLFQARTRVPVRFVYCFSSRVSQKRNQKCHSKDSPWSAFVSYLYGYTGITFAFAAVSADLLLYKFRCRVAADISLLPENQPTTTTSNQQHVQILRSVPLRRRGLCGGQARGDCPTGVQRLLLPPGGRLPLLVCLHRRLHSPRLRRLLRLLRVSLCVRLLRIPLCRLLPLIRDWPLEKHNLDTGPPHQPPNNMDTPICTCNHLQPPATTAPPPPPAHLCTAPPSALSFFFLSLPKHTAGS